MQNDMRKYYLWALVTGFEDMPAGTLIADRYLSQGGRIFVDTQPEQLPQTPGNDITAEEISCYLKLFSERLHIPQVYGWIPAAKSPLKKDIWLLEGCPIEPKSGELRPLLSQVWEETSAMRQLSWLWQIATLWYPLSCQGVASSLLDFDLLRVEGPLVRLLELRYQAKAAGLSQLGSVWQSLIPTADRRIQKFLEQLTQQLIAGEIRKSMRLASQLDQALVICGRSLERQVDIVTVTDAGPTRSHNEDACYRSAYNDGIDENSMALAIVCDGIGGQEGGEVASGLAIEIVREQMEKIPLPTANWDPLSLTNRLKRAISIANDAISDRNDTEERQGRQRMGTTIVMALAHVHEIYLTHIGDSRAYWITPEGCYQVTLDDDVASREVRLGYTIYREALQQVSSGALIQALGITHSLNLHPTIQRFPVDSDCIFVLCSDGLSDRDRVEQYWESEILPVLQGQTTLPSVRDRLLKIANTQNGHDNVTIALLHFQVSPKTIQDLPEISVPTAISLNDDTIADSSSDLSGSDDSAMQTELIVVDKNKSRSIWLLSLGILILLGIGGALAWTFLGGDQTTEPDEPPTSTPLTTRPADPSLPTPTVPYGAGVPLGSVIQLSSARTIQNNIPPSPIVLHQDFVEGELKGEVPSNSVFQVLERQTTQNDGTWVELKVCSVPSSHNLATPDNNTPLPTELDDSDPQGINQPIDNLEEITTLQPGDRGWLREDDVQSLWLTDVIIPPEQYGNCQVNSVGTLGDN